MAYVFDPEGLAECARVGQGFPLAQRLEARLSLASFIHGPVGISPPWYSQDY